MNRFNELDLTNEPWAPLFRLSAYLSAVMLLFIPVQIVIFTLFPPPNTIEGFFQLYKESWLLGLLNFDFIYILNNLILIFIYLSLAVCLFREKPASSMVALILGIIGIACYFPTNPAFEMLNLSQSYWKAIPEAQSKYLAAGETLLACYKGTAFDVYYVLNAIALLLFSAVIYKSPQFNKPMGIVGLVSGILMIVPSSAGIIGMSFSLLSLIPWVIFLFMLSKKLYGLSKIQ